MGTVGERARRFESYWSLANLVWSSAIVGGSLMLGWWAAAIAWAEGTIQPYGTLGYIVTVLVVALFLGIVFLAISAGVWFWRRGGSAAPDSTQPALTQPEQEYSADPEAEALDKGAYNQIVAFCIDFLLPACGAQVELQEGIIRDLCGNEKVVAWALEGLRSDYNYKTSGFWQNYTSLSSGLTDSPGPSIKFEGMIECINELEKEFYKNFCDQAIEVAQSAGIDLKNSAVIAEWHRWHDHHGKMVDAFEMLKRDIRFGKLHRLRPSRWGSYSL